MAKEESIWTSLTVLVLGLLAIAPATALITGWVMSKYWDWFIARDYGAAPSLATFFGIASIVTLLVALATVKIKREKQDSSWGDVIVSVSAWVGMLLGLGISGLTGKILGWL